MQQVADVFLIGLTKDETIESQPDRRGDYGREYATRLFPATTATNCLPLFP